MEFFNYIDVIAAVAGLAASGLLCVFPRFGSASWFVVLTLVPASLACAIQGLGAAFGWAADEVVLLTFCCLVVCGACGCLASYCLERADFQADLKKSRWFFVGICAAAPILIASVYVFRQVPIEIEASVDLVALGPGGYASAAYLLLASVITLANIEQTLRSAEEHIRWEVKFLLLGFAGIFGAILYIASQVLLYPPEFAVLPAQALHVFSVIFAVSSWLVFQSWKRCTGRGRVTVSHGVVYSTITLFSVGIYLVATSVVAHWLSEWTGSTAPLEPILFLISAIALSAVFLGTAFRHRVRRWIRKNLLAGKYDYRQLWMDSTEKVRAIDSSQATAAALAQLIQSALGAIDITVWLRCRDAQMLRFALGRGPSSEKFSDETLAVSDDTTDLTEPIAAADLKWDSASMEILGRARASLVVPLISSGRMVGLLTVGADRSGRTFDSEAREFLRVLAVHAASEFHKAELLERLVQIREAEAFRTFSTFLLHDLKNFASTLSLIANNAVRHHGNPDFQLDAFQSVLDTAEKMKRLCNGLRTFSTSLAGNKRSEDVNEVVRDVVGEFQAGLSQRLKLDLGVVPKTEIDRQEFSRVLQNLIVNASEASPSGPIEVSTRIGSNDIAVCVRDWGKGIPKDFLKNELFQPFHTTKGDGLGIGLFQCKKIVEAHDGTIELDSTEGVGTVVRILLPVTTAVESSAKTHSAEPHIEKLIHETNQFVT